MKERGHQGEKKELFWIFLTTMVILVLIALIANFTPHGATGHFVAIQNIAYQQAGDELPMAVKDVKGMHTANFELLEEIKGGQITFTEDDTIAFDGIAYSKFVVASTDEDKLGGIKITMKIRQADLREIRLTPEDVTLYVNGQEERTRIDRTEGEYEFYTADTEEFGNYVIGKMREEEAPREVIAPPQIASEPVGQLIEVMEEPVRREPVSEGKISFWQKMVDWFKELFD